MTTRRPADDILIAELQKLLRQEMAAGLSTVFADMRSHAQERPANSFSASGGLNIVIHNNAGAEVSARETPGPFGEKRLEITIDQMVARALAGGRETSGVMRSLFGIVPGLIGR